VLQFIDDLEVLSGGRLVGEPIWEETVLPISDQMGGLRDGVFDFLYCSSGYWEGQIPAVHAYAWAEFVLRGIEDWDAMFQHWGWGEIVDDVFADWNVKVVDTNVYDPGGYMISKKSLATYEDLKGQKMRCFGIAASYFEAAGAGTVWLPGSEIYTSLASGLIDGVLWGVWADYYSYGWHEVTKYWLDFQVYGSISQSLHANMDFWESLSEADQLMVKRVAQANGLQMHNTMNYDSMVALKKAQDEAGIVVQTWDAASQKKWLDSVYELGPGEMEDAAGEEMIAELYDYIKYKGYIK
jgi:TRAP-type C4-dicarboxylate transport system substrate-binding protein